MSRSENSGKGCKHYPRRGRGFKRWARPYTRAARRKTVLILAAGKEPPPSRHRHGALWDYW